MIFFLYGKDSYRLYQRRQEIIDDLKNTNGSELYELSLSQSTDHKKFSDILKVDSFFNNSKAILISNSFYPNGNPSTIITQQKLSLNTNNYVIFSETQSSAELKKINRDLFSLLSSKSNTVESFEPLSAKDFESWALTHVKKASCDISLTNLRFLIGLIPTRNPKAKDTPPDSWRFINEIDKLISYRTTFPDHTITKEDIALLVSINRDPKFYDLLDALSDKNKPLAFTLLSHHLENHADPRHILSSFISQFRKLIGFKALSEKSMSTESIISETKAHPYVVQKTLKQSSHFRKPELTQNFTALSELDQDIKKGIITAEDGLYEFILT